MAARPTLRYNRARNILYIDEGPPHAEQESEQLGDDVLARLNASTGEIENLEVLFLSTRLLRTDLIEFPVQPSLRMPRA